MSNTPNPPKKQEEPLNTTSVNTRKKRQEMLSALGELLEAAKSNADVIAALATQAKDENANARTLIEDCKKACTEGKQSCTTIITSMKASKSQCDAWVDDISDLHANIFGGEEADSEGSDGDDAEATDSDCEKGLKYELENAYKEIQEGLETLDKNFVQFQAEKNEVFSKTLYEHGQRFEGIRDRIESLLPGALSAGLSSAFQKKRETIETTQKWHYIGFIVSIAILSIIFCVTFFATMNTSTYDVFFFFICRNLLMASPILWLAIFFNRKLNLDTRLIEEYTHKETVSKTFEGLSKEIQKMDEDDSANQLLQQLLQATMDVNTTNPGKLVKGYDAIDHPITEIAPALTSLSALFKEINALKKLPGFDLSNIMRVVGLALAQNRPISFPAPAEDDGEEQEA